MPKAPIAMIKDTVFKEHGMERVDPYYWLNKKEDSTVLNYLNDENDYLKKIMVPTEALQEEIHNEITGRIQKDEETVPFFNNGYWYYTRYVESGEYPLKCRKKQTLDADEEIIIDGNELAKGCSFFRIGDWEVSPDNKKIAYSTDTIGRRKYDIYFKNLETGKMYSDVISTTSGSSTWANDNKTLFFSTIDKTTLRSDKIQKYTLGDSTAAQEVYFESDDTFETYCYKTLSRKYIVIASSSSLTNSFQLIDADDPNREPRVFSPRVRDHKYDFTHQDDKFYIRSNLNAINFRIMMTDDQSTGIENWQEVTAHSEDTLIETIFALKNYLIVEERTNGLNQIKIWNTENNEVSYLPFEEETYLAYTTANYDYESIELRYKYQSMTTPGSIFDYNLENKQKQLKKTDPVLGGHDPSQYETKRIFAGARDGTMVPISMVYKKDTPINGTSPLLLYGYGSYGSTIDPYFSISRLSLLDRGFIFAIAHVRGGQMMGRQWYEDGKLLKKKNTFNDFIDCGKYLTANNICSADNMYASGGSAGGLLVGAVINMEPDLFKGVLAAVPFVDVVTTMLDTSIPLTTGEYDEWGNPNIKEYYDYMLSYSPYDNVAAQNYPNLLITTGLHDSQVQYFEPAKWAAKLRANKTDNNTLLLSTNMDAGHGGASGRYQKYKEVALEYAFILNLVESK
ncbi:MAG: S9 family peptidase [Reichenbachiella sp.]